MINTLHSSKEGGAKLLQLNSGKVPFTWQVIEELWLRECERMSKKIGRQVPGLLKKDIVRDPWTKLSVGPAKIMQQQNVLAELKNFGRLNPDRTDVFDALQYLQACNQLFENGFLSHSPIKGTLPQAYVPTWALCLIGTRFFKYNPQKKHFN